jgi:hypothetical protein
MRGKLAALIAAPLLFAACGKPVSPQVAAAPTTAAPAEPVGYMPDAEARLVAQAAINSVDGGAQKICDALEEVGFDEAESAFAQGYTRSGRSRAESDYIFGYVIRAADC